MTGWIEPTSDQLDDARRALKEIGEPAELALDYIGAHLNRIAKADFSADDIRRAIAMYRAFEEVDRG